MVASISLDATDVEAALSSARVVVVIPEREQNRYPADSDLVPLDDDWGFDVVTRRDSVPRMHGVLRCPLGAPGDLVYVKEAVVARPDGSRSAPPGWVYEADGGPVRANVPGSRRRLGAHQIPRRVSRLTLELDQIGLDRRNALPAFSDRAVVAPGWHRFLQSYYDRQWPDRPQGPPLVWLLRAAVIREAVDELDRIRVGRGGLRERRA